ncbi:DoxX family membrane protein [Amycolatopsis lurida]
MGGSAPPPSPTPQPNSSPSTASTNLPPANHPPPRRRPQPARPHPGQPRQPASTSLARRRYSLLTLRLAVGVVFVAHGWGDASQDGGATANVTHCRNAGIPLPELSAWFAAYPQLAGGIVVLFGALTRLIGAGFAVVMASALIFAHPGEPLVLAQDGSGSGFAFIMLAASLALLGTGTPPRTLPRSSSPRACGVGRRGVRAEWRSRTSQGHRRPRAPGRSGCPYMPASVSTWPTSPAPEPPAPDEEDRVKASVKLAVAAGCVALAPVLLLSPPPSARSWAPTGPAAAQAGSSPARQPAHRPAAWPDTAPTRSLTPPPSSPSAKSSRCPNTGG